MTKENTYSKQEKLKGRTLVQKVFTKGKSFTVFPLKIFYWLSEHEEHFNLKTGVGTTSRNFKKAVERNRIKRLLRETYRMEKGILRDYLLTTKKQTAIFILYIDKEMPGHIALKQKMQKALQKLINKLDEENIADT